MTGSEMAKAGLREQNRLSGANRNTLIAGGIMANTAEIFNFPVPDEAQKERRVADLDDGYTRIANELLEAVMLAGLTQHQLLVFLAVMRKTYGFNKKQDWVSNEQLSELTGILPHKCSAAKSVLVKRGIFIQSGRNIGINNVVSEWSTLPESGCQMIFQPLLVLRLRHFKWVTWTPTDDQMCIVEYRFVFVPGRKGQQ